MKKIVLFSGLFCLSILTYAQNGPGGVGNNDGSTSLKMWYRPDYGVTAGTNVSVWANGAGVAAHDMTAAGTLQPTLNVGAVNGYDELTFDGNNRMQITGALTTANFVNNEASSFVVAKRNATTSSWVYATSPHQTNRFSCHISWSNGTVYYDTGNCCGSASRLQVGGLTGLNAYSYWSYDALNASGKQLYRNGTLLQNRASTTTYNSHASHTFRIGENYNGGLTEVIIYNQKINTAQRLIVENYVSAKYNITPASNDIYDEDDAGNGNYDHDVAGIGRVDATNLHTDSRGTGIVRVLNASNLGDDEFFMWGHDGGVQQAIEFGDLPTPVRSRFDRVWRVSEVDVSGTAVDVGSVSIRFDLTGLGAVTASDLRLLVDVNNDGFFVDETVGGGGLIAGATSLGGNIYEFTGVTAITNNLRFTIGTINTNQTPLPIELLSFEANYEAERTTRIQWRTASEVGNDYFTIEKSIDGQNWEELIQTDGAGNSTETMFYSEYDFQTYLGTSYYRLKQTDFDGNYTYSMIRSVTLGENEILDVFPNPTNGVLNLRGSTAELSEIQVYNMLGENVTSQVTILKEDGNAVLDVKELMNGIYVIQTKTLNTKFIKE